MFLTSTMQLGRVYDAACELLTAEGTGRSGDDVMAIPIVGECDDSDLSDVRRMQVTHEDVAAASMPRPASVGSQAHLPRARLAPGPE